MRDHVCGLFYVHVHTGVRRYLPQVRLGARVSIISSVSKTTLTQTFVNSSSEPLKEVKYAFPLYDGVSVVAFKCTVGDKTITGVVREKEQARQDYKKAVDDGKTAGLLEQAGSPDVFMTSVGNIPGGANVQVEVVFLGELKHDAQVDGIRYILPTHIAPRYGSYPGELLSANTSLDKSGGIDIVVDAEMPSGSSIKAIESPSHPIAVRIGVNSTAPDADPSLQRASASLALGSAELDKDFILQVVATNTSNPVAVVESHPTIPGERAIMATLVPKFSLPPERPEIVFVCDRSGSMGWGDKMPNLKSALHIFLKSLPRGTAFNICSFGSSFSLLFEKSQPYSQATLDQAVSHVQGFAADYGGTEMYKPMEAVMKGRHPDMNLEVFLLTDGDIWDQQRLIQLINTQVSESKGAVRVFTLGIGTDASSSLIEGVARAGNGFSQAVGENEKIDSKVVRMLKGALSPHVSDYTIEVKYGKSTGDHGDDDFEMIDAVSDCLVVNTGSEAPPGEVAPKKPISLFDASSDGDADTGGDGAVEKKYDHLPAVPAPKVLQAPFEIPPLFPFNRTSVYLLLNSPSAVHRPVKSVVLKGTSIHGPLELEIPVTTLDTPGTTIHQLAARKAVKELEEGRGWIYNAKAKGGKLLKDEYPGRFPEMVEREAVRLGVKYQVAGKWCSFVAVDREHSTNPGEDAEEYGIIINESGVLEDEDVGDVEERTVVKRKSGAGAYKYRQRVAASGPTTVPRAETRAFISPSGTAAPAPPPPTTAPGFVTAACAAPPPPPAYGRPRPAPMVAPMAPAPRPGGFGAPLAAQPTGAFAAPPAEMLARRSPSEGDDRRGVDNAKLPDNINSLLVRGERMPELEKSASKGRTAMASARFRQAKPDLGARSTQNMQSTPGGQGMSADPLESIVRLQTFEGFWEYSSELLSVMGITKDAIDKALSERGTEWSKVMQSSANGRTTATVCVLVFLRKKLSPQRDSWEMMADKARDWLGESLGGLGVGVAEVENCLEGIF